MNCEIDYCTETAMTTLQVETDREIITVEFCKEHADALEKRLGEKSGFPVRLIDLRSRPFGGTVGELSEAIDYLDAVAASEHGGGH